MPSVLITGANRGLGFEFVKQYLANGWQIYAACWIIHPRQKTPWR